jgi:hypothetical protein
MGGFAPFLGLGFRRSRFRGQTLACRARLGGKSPTWRRRVAFLLIAKRRRCKRLAISEAEFVGHSVISSRSSSSVQRDIVESRL